jgi:hypothetical protein
MIAEIRGNLKRCDPVFHPSHRLDDVLRDERINPKREALMRFAVLRTEACVLEKQAEFFQ